MTGAGRVIRTTFPSVCEECGKVIPVGDHCLWDGAATCIPCLEKDRGVVGEKKPRRRGR
jgi:formylmethanofuran dehydrogenase subunit E